MRPGQRRFSRRALLVGAGAATAYGVVRLFELESGGPAAVPSPRPHPPTTEPPLGQLVDLTVRWRDLQTAVDRTGLVAAWRFDEAAGYAFADATGRGHTLYATGDDWNTTESGLVGSLHRKGFRAGACWLSGSRWLQADFAWDLLSPSGLSVGCRIRPQRLNASPALLVGYGTAYALTMDSTGAVSLTMTDTDGTTQLVRSPSGTVVAESWTHLVASVQPAQGELVLYANGIAVARTITSPFELVSKLQRMTVGSGFVGLVDEVTIHDVALDGTGIDSLYLLGLPTIYTQTSESIDDDKRVSTRFRGSDPVPHPAAVGTVLLHRFSPATAQQELTLVPGVFGAAWKATGRSLVEDSPLSGGAGTFEAWYRTIDDPADPNRQRRKEILTATGLSGSLTVYSQDGRWCFELRRPGTPTATRRSAPHPFLPGLLEHVAVAWGTQADGGHGVVLYVNGVPSASVGTRPGQTTYRSRVTLGGTAAAPAFCLFDDVRITDSALPWGEICPRGHAASGVAGLDLRDRFNRPPGAAPLLWRPGAVDGRWSHQVMTWRDPQLVGDDPASARALFQATAAGVHAIYHPDAYGYRSSMEAGVSFGSVVDGWAGLFVQSAEVGGGFGGLTFMVNPARNAMRLARYANGRVLVEKVLPYDFTMHAHATYELTLTNAGDGVVRGFVDGSNLISLRTPADWPDAGHAGMVTDGTAAYFSDLHFCALTLPILESRTIRTRTITYGHGVRVSALDLMPFRWDRRPGLLPWQYIRKNPEAPGAIAGAATTTPPRPIAPAAWRSEDSANSDLLTIDGTVWFFMRGNPRVDDHPQAARIGVLHAKVDDFDGVHFTDPNAVTATLDGGTLLLAPTPHQLNAPATAYVGDGRVLFLGREFARETAATPAFDAVVYSRFDVRAGTWETVVPSRLPWGRAPDPDATPTVESAQLIHGSPEVLALREPDGDAYQAVVFQQTGAPGEAVMATALLTDVSGGVPVPTPGLPVHTSLSRPSGRAIYGFRILFDNGIYYLHYNEGPHVPDWPDRFVLAAALDPYAGPWVASPATLPETSTYFRRGSVLRPDNGAIWQGTMVKHRGRYYLYYECYHSIGDVNAPYDDYADPQAGSRVGFATV